MAHTPSMTARQAKNAAVAQAKRQADNPAIELLERFGFIVRGAIYVLIGFLALKLALGAGGTAANPTSVITLIGRQPYGKLLLIVVAIGLAGYSLWGFVRALLDPLHRGNDMKGLVDRAGFLFSGISYGLLLIPTLQTFFNKSTSGAQATAASGGVPASLLSGSNGQWLVMALGVFWIAIGIGQLIIAYQEQFMNYLNTGQMNAEERKSAELLGRIGYAARGIVFGLIGLILLQIAPSSTAAHGAGFDAALNTLARGPFGALELGVVAFGLVLFGAYSAVAAKWTRISSRG